MSKEYKTKNYDTEKSKEYYKNNSEYIIQRQKEYDRINAIERPLYFRDHYIENREMILERCKAHARNKRGKPPVSICEVKPAILTSQKNVIIVFD
jgi:hypothetical protein